MGTLSFQAPQGVTLAMAKPTLTPVLRLALGTQPREPNLLNPETSKVPWEGQVFPWDLLYQQVASPQEGMGGVPGSSPT